MCSTEAATQRGAEEPEARRKVRKTELKIKISSLERAGDSLRKRMGEAQAGSKHRMHV